MSDEMVSDYDCRQINKVFDKIRTEFVRTLRTPQGGQSQYLKGSLVFENVQPARRSRSRDQKHSIMFFSLPYFSLERITQPGASKKTAIHTPRTLLQVLYSSSDRNRELQQAVCQLTQTQKQHCFHVNQMWCLLLNESKNSCLVDFLHILRACPYRTSSHWWTNPYIRSARRLYTLDYPEMECPLRPGASTLSSGDWTGPEAVDASHQFMRDLACM